MCRNATKPRALTGQSANNSWACSSPNISQAKLRSHTGSASKSATNAAPSRQLTADQAGLIVIGEPTIEKRLDKALTKAAKVVKRKVDATTDEITSELQEALKS